MRKNEGNKIRITCVESYLEKFSKIQMILSDLNATNSLLILSKLKENDSFNDAETAKSSFLCVFAELEVKPHEYSYYLQLFKNILSENKEFAPLVVSSAFKTTSEETYGIKFSSFLLIRDLLDAELIDSSLILMEFSSFPLFLPNQLFLAFYIFEYLLMENEELYNNVSVTLLYSSDPTQNANILIPEFAKLMRTLREERKKVSISTPFDESVFLRIAADDNIEEYKAFIQENDCNENVSNFLMKERCFNPYFIQQSTKQSEVLSYIGSINCISFLIGERICVPTKASKECSFAIAGGSNEMYELLDENGFQFNDCLKVAAYHHQYNIFDKIVETKKMLIPNFIHEMNACIIECAKSGNVLTCIKCLSLKGKFTYKDKFMRTALSYAAEYGSIKIMKLAIAYNQFMASEQDVNGRIPLHYAVIQSKYEAVELLLKITEDINIEDKNGKTPRQYAIGNDRIESLFLLASQE